MKFVAITACPTGIAHSQMAAENLEQTAERLGHEIHVEIHGAMGTENEIPDETLAAADAVIIAADTGVSRERFGDHIVVKGTVKDGVNDAEGLIEEAVDRVEAEGGAAAIDTAGSESADAESTGAAPPDSDVADSEPVDSEPSTPPETDTTTEAESASDNGGVIARLKRLFS